MSAQALAETLGIGKSSVTRYESGTRMPDAWYVAFLSRMANVSADWLFTGRESMQPEEDRAPAGAFNRERLRDVVEVLEEVIAEQHLVLTVSKKADVVVLLYEEITEWEEAGMEYDKDKIVRLVRLAS